MNRSAVAAVLLCAWVLWTDQTPRSGERRWDVSYSFETKQECDSAALTMDRAPMTAHGDMTQVLRMERHGNGVRAYYADGTMSSATFVCVPDTVNPRGPKGK